MEFFETIGDWHSQGVAFNNLVSVMVQRGDPAGALDPLTHGNELRIAIGDRKGQSSSLCNLADAHRELGRIADRQSITS